jgi:hypothetical protein
MHKFVFTGYIYKHSKIKKLLLDNPIKQPYVTEQKIGELLSNVAKNINFEENRKNLSSK